MSVVSDAVILIAGQGSRLRGADKDCLKPFVPVLGRPLLSYTLEAVSAAGISTTYFVVGYESERVIAQAKQLIPPHINASFILNRDWQKQKAVSLFPKRRFLSAPLFF